MAITDADIIKAATSLGLLANGPHVAHSILAALCNPDIGTAEITGLIEHEPGLAARVLKVANSAYYGHSRHIATLDRALLVLGVEAVRGITAAACLDRSIQRRGPITGAGPHTLVNHCVASAFAAEQLARRSGRAQAAEAFMAGLLHEFGVPIQERIDPQGVEALATALRNSEDADAGLLEKALVQVGHTRCAQVVFEHWQMPASIVQAAAHHDNPADAPPEVRELTALVHVGIQLAIEAGFTYPLEPRQFRIPREPLLESLGLDEAAAKEITAGLAERVLLLTGHSG